MCFRAIHFLFCVVSVSQCLDTNRTLQENDPSVTDATLGLTKSSLDGLMHVILGIMRKKNTDTKEDYDYDSCPSEKEKESENENDSENLKKSSLVTLSDGTILIEPVVEHELPGLVQYFNKNLDFGAFSTYRELYTALYYCANGPKGRTYTVYDSVDINWAIISLKTAIMRQKIEKKKIMLQSTLADIETQIRRKCDEFKNAEHPLSKELLRLEANKK